MTLELTGVNHAHSLSSEHLVPLRRTPSGELGSFVSMAFAAQGVLNLHSSDPARMQTAITTVNIKTSYGCIEWKEVFQLHAALGEGRKR